MLLKTNRLLPRKLDLDAIDSFGERDIAGARAALVN